MTKNWFKSHPVLTYYALVLAISWGGILAVAGPSGIFASKANPAVLSQFIYVAALAGPSIAGVLMTGFIHGKAGLRDLLARTLRWRVGVRWYMVALLTAPVLMTAMLFGLSLTSSGFVPAIITSNETIGLILSGIVMGLVVCFFEELGWMGFAAPELRKRYDFLATGIIMGVPWGAWHYPLFSASASASEAVQPQLYVAVMLFSFLLPFRILMVWVYDRTNSVLVVMLMHAPLAAGMTILLPSAMAGERVVIFDLTFAAALWLVVAVIYLTTREGGCRKPHPSIEASRPQS
jgi:uncharacterized protein